ncbi:hypothetical protein BJ508DRAFT_34971 [Ascobolus immersus RN42]|uniref:Uncharacterized protein n=1 Tax=Ascobolus immersus RN42 TaxID=1160509 RepID=A0A3N4HL00_ASCIM|nr:hypothetical protein BJ508DRAFT_34971 [Ascobolus immersus RN42]
MQILTGSAFLWLQSNFPSPSTTTSPLSFPPHLLPIGPKRVNVNNLGTPSKKLCPYQSMSSDAPTDMSSHDYDYYFRRIITTASMYLESLRNFIAKLRARGKIYGNEGSAIGILILQWGEVRKLQIPEHPSFHIICKTHDLGLTDCEDPDCWKKFRKAQKVRLWCDKEEENVSRMLDNALCPLQDIGIRDMRNLVRPMLVALIIRAMESWERRFEECLIAESSVLPGTGLDKYGR